MIVKHRNHPYSHKKAAYECKTDPDLKNYDPVICKTIQWIVCAIFSLALILIACCIAFPSIKIKKSLYTSYHSPSCTILNGKLSALQQPNSFNDLMHCPLFVPINKQKDNQLALLTAKRKEFESVMKDKWDQSMQRGVFAYFVDNLPKKLLSRESAEISFEILYNPQRALSKKEKPTKVSTDINVKQPWNENAFNFYKANGDDLMFVIDDEFMNLDEALFSCYKSDSEEGRDWKQKHFILSNKFPIGKYSGLFVPFFGSHSPQILSLKSIKRAIHFSNLFYSDSIRIGYNSMGAMASVNMLHFQFWEKKGSKLAIEVLADHLSARNVGILHAGKELIVREIIGYPVHGFVYEHRQKIVERGLVADVLGNALYHCVDYLIQSNVPHNLLINRSKIFLFVRQPQKASKLPIYYGFTECSGWITVLNEEKFENITMQELWNDFQEIVSIKDEEKWESIKAHCSALP